MGGQQSTSKITKKSKIIDLTDQVIEKIPPIPRDNNVRTLILTRTYIKDLPIPLPKLKSLILSDNSFTQLPADYEDAFNSYLKLEVLDLSGNKLEEYPEIIDSIKNLKTLNLFYNKLKSLKISSNTIENLNIGNNSFTSFPKIPKSITSLTYDFNLLSDLELEHPRMTYLSLELVGLSNISPDIKFPKLETLNLSRNNLTEIPNLQKFSPILKVLNLSDNFLTSFPVPPQTIESINLHSNQISEIPDIIADFHSLKFLDIGENQLTYVPEIPDTISEFIFSQNKITKVKTSYTPNLKRLLFRDNQLTEFPCYKSSNVREFSCNCNQITKIDTTYLNETAYRIDYSNNLIKTIPSAVFKLNYLTALLLANNQIQTLPNAITNARILTLLNLTNNPIKELPPLPRTLQNLYIGYCGIKSLNSCLKFCSKLVLLDAPGNRLTDVPYLPSIRRLLLARNSFQTFPEHLHQKLLTLDLSCNQISTLPDNFNFSDLDELDLSDNPISNFPRNFQCPKLKFLRLNNTQINTHFHVSQFFTSNNCLELEVLDIINSGVTFDIEPNVRELFVDKRLPQYKTKHVKEISLNSWISVSEMKGTRDEMEDAVCIRSFVQKDVDIYCVFDGHGGKSTSAFCSIFMSDAFRINEAKCTRKFVYSTLKKLDSIIRKRTFCDGSTAACCVFNGKKVISSHIGDSRVLVISESGTVKFKTVDHKAVYRNEFERIRMEGSRIENNRTFGMIALGRSLGDINIPGISAEPEVHQYFVEDDDRWIVIACDGVFDVLSNEYIGQIASKANCANELACDIRNIAYANLSTDNITVIAIDIKERKKELQLKQKDPSFSKMDDESDDGDDENFAVTPVHLNFDLKDVDPSLYMSSGLVSCNSSTWSFLSKETNEGIPDQQLIEIDIGNSILRQPSTFEELNLNTDIEVPIVSENKENDNDDDDEKSEDSEKDDDDE